METRQSEESSLEREGPCATIRKAEGAYSFLYGVHVLADDPADLPLDADGVVLETGETRWDKKPLREIAYFKHSPINRQLRRIIPEAERRGLPLYFLDPVWTQTRRRLLADLAIIGGEAMAGMKVWGIPLRRRRSNAPIASIPSRGCFSRRYATSSSRRSLNGSCDSRSRGGISAR